MAEIARDFGLVLAADIAKEAQIAALLRHASITLPDLLRAFGRDELKLACRAHQLDESGRSRADLAARLLGASQPGTAPAAEPAPAPPRLVPIVGDIVQVRHRQYLVTTVSPPADPHQMTCVGLVCLDDDAQGRVLQVLWELELGARVLQPEAHGLGELRRLDPPDEFAAYLDCARYYR
jgi:hypothetical protein